MTKLTDAKLRSLTAPGKYFDGGGLYLEVTAAGGRYFRLKYRFGGKEKRLAFGVYPDVTLKQAREQRDQARAVLAKGEDPAEVKRQAAAAAQIEAARSVEAVSRAWLDHKRGAKWSPRTYTMATRSLELDVFPVIGSRPMASIRASEIRELVRAIEARGAAETASRVLQRLNAVFRYAAGNDLIETNPLLNLKADEVLKGRPVRHRAAMPERDVPGFLAALAQYRGEPTVLAGLEVLMLTAVRPGELRGAEWRELDLTAAQWRIPADRMKMKAEHLVPLSRQAVAVLTRLQAQTGRGALVFPSPFYPGKPISENTLNSALARMGYKGAHTAHGFRALFSTVANEQGKDADAIERQLAHIERNQVRAAYHRGEYIAQRAELMQWWADWIDARRPGGAPGDAGA